MNENRTAVGLRLLFLSLAFHAGPLFAAEDTAHLTFNKTVVVRNSKAYVVRKGDTVINLIRRNRAHFPKTVSSYAVIKQLNPGLSNLDRIYPGQEIFLPLATEEGQEENEAVRDYIVKKGDSLTRIILYEMRVPPQDVVKSLRRIKRLNPGVGNLNRISPGLALKIPDGGKKEDVAQPAVKEQPKEAEKPVPAQAPARISKEGHLGLIVPLVRRLKGSVITAGQYYIPIPGAGQVTVDCREIPVVEMADGSTILLDFTGRLPDALTGMIQDNWQNYRVVKIGQKDETASVLQKIINASRNYRMERAARPVLLSPEPQVQVSLDWLIEGKSSAGKVDYRLGLIFASDESRLLPAAFLAYANRKGLFIDQIVANEVQGSAGGTAFYAAETPRLKGETNGDLLYDFLVAMGFAPQRDREVKIFNAAKDGFDLSIKADLLVKAAGKTIVIHESRLPKQFTDILEAGGTAALYIAPDTPRKTALEKLLSALEKPFISARFSLPEGDDKSRIVIALSAIKIAERPGTYLIDFEPEGEIARLMQKDWGMKIIRY